MVRRLQLSGRTGRGGLSVISKRLVRQAVEQSMALSENERRVHPAIEPMPHQSGGRPGSAPGSPPRTGYRSPCSDASGPVSKGPCASCGCFPPTTALRVDSTPLLD